MLTGLRILTYDGSKITKISSEVDSIDTIKNMDSDTKNYYTFPTVALQNRYNYHQP